MSKLSINFNTLKYNLYDIMKVNKTTDKSIIRKKYKKLMLKYHPDKSTELEEEIFNHIIIAYKVLSNDNYKKKYDKYLSKYNSHHDLKENFKKPKIAVSFDEAKKDFKSMEKKLYQKHKIDDILLKNKNKKRTDIDIIKKKYKDTGDFNNNFDNYKKEIKKSNKVVIYSHNKELSHYASTKDYNILYVEDNNNDKNYSNIRKAHKLSPYIKYNEKNVKREYIVKKDLYR